MGTELLVNAGVLVVGLIGGMVVGYHVLPIFWKHNPNLTPATIQAHLEDVGKDFEEQAPVIVAAHANAMIASIKAAAVKLGATIAA